MKIIATYNLKGGVGKTTTTVNLAWLAARQGHRTLVCDLDPQGATSFYFRVKPRVKGGGERVLDRKRDLDSRIKGTDFDGLDLLPADFSFRHLDLMLNDAKRPEQTLRKVLRPLAKHYDYLFIDCAPSISHVSESVFEAANVLLVPTVPTPLSMRTLDMLSQHLKGRARRPKVLPFFSKVERRNSVHRDLCVPGSKRGRYRFLETAIPQSTIIEKMGTRRAPAVSYAPRSRPGRAYSGLWKEVRKHTH